MNLNIYQGTAHAVLALALLAGTALTGCDSLSRAAAASSLIGSGRLVTNEYQISDFDGISADATFKVEVRQADSFGVTVTTDDNAVDALDVFKEGNTLRLSVKPGSYTHVTRRAEVSLPKLAGVRLSGASAAHLSGFDALATLGLDLSGASRLTGKVSAKNTRLELAGASKVNLVGGTDRLDLQSTGASNADLAGYPTRDADVRLDGASQASIEVDGRLNVDLKGASTLLYSGRPTLGRADTEGGASLRRR